MAGEALNVFISYSRRDEGLKDELVNYHLKLLQREGKINTWQDRDIEAGTEWAAEIKINLEKADIVLLLITRHFLASDYCCETEMQRAMQRHDEGTARVIPVILEPCSWKYSDFKQLQVLPEDGKPITRWEDKAEAFLDVEEGIRRVVNALNAQKRDAEVVKARAAEELRQQQAEVARLEEEKKERKRQAAKQRQQEAAARRQEQARLGQERLAAEQCQREQAEDQRTEQERQQQTVQKQRDIEVSSKTNPLQQNLDNQDNVNDGAISSAAVVETVDANSEPSENAKQETLIEKITIWEIPLDRRSTLLWLAGGIGGLIFGGATPKTKKWVVKSNQASNSWGSAPELKTFNFSVISLNTQGEELSRVQKKNEYFTENLGQGVSLDMVVVPGGNFMMGSPDGEGYADEKPQHQVMVKPFYMGKFPVTQAQWKAVATMPKVQRELKPDPSTFKGMMKPVEEVSWNDAVEFCQRLSRYSNRQYRLPNEAEWEFACRAGTSTPFNFGSTITTDFANYNGNYIYGFASKGMMFQETTEVGSFSPNALGLYDMHGNVWEWCEDHWHDNYDDAPKFNYSWLSRDESTPRLLRGGSWHDDPKNCRSASRSRKNSDLISSLFSFRVVCVPA